MLVYNSDMCKRTIITFFWVCKCTFSLWFLFLWVRLAGEEDLLKRLNRRQTLQCAAWYGEMVWLYLYVTLQKQLLELQRDKIDVTNYEDLGKDHREKPQGGNNYRRTVWFHAGQRDDECNIPGKANDGKHWEKPKGLNVFIDLNKANDRVLVNSSRRSFTWVSW